MRWFWIDRFVEFVCGERAVASKNVAATEEQLDEYLPGFPIMPAPFIIEGMAQTGGLLVSQVNDFKEKVVLAKVAKAEFKCLARPGDVLTYTATLENLQGVGAMVSGVSRIGDEVQAEIDLFFAHLDDRFKGVELFRPADFSRMLRTLGLFEVGRHPDGSPLQVPQYMVDAEAAEMQAEQAAQGED
jgi:3-hydroxyacyl-[acyl-carrier-protein] dehydratase